MYNFIYIYIHITFRTLQIFFHFSIFLRIYLLFVIKLKNQVSMLHFLHIIIISLVIYVCMTNNKLQIC